MIFPYTSFAQEIKPYRTGIIVENLQLSSVWYANVFDVKVYKDLSFPEDGVRVSLLKNDYLDFELVERRSSFSIEEILPEYNNKEKPLQGFYKIAFEVDDIEKMYDKVKKVEAEIYFDLFVDEELKIKTFIIKDPDKNLLQFVEKRAD